MIDWTEANSRLEQLNLTLGIESDKFSVSLEPATFKAHSSGSWRLFATEIRCLELRLSIYNIARMRSLKIVGIKIK